MSEASVIEGTCSSGGCERPARLELSPAMQRAFGGASEADLLCDECAEEQREREQREEAEADRQQRREEQLALRRRRAALPAKWQAQTFEEIEDDERRRPARESAAMWAAGQLGRQGLVLWGAVGRGKTAMAAAAANARLQIAAVRWMPVAELLLDLRMPFDSPEYLRALRKLEPGRAGLVLDDLDKFKPSEHAVQPVYVAVNAWIEAELPLLVTLNRDLDALQDWLPEGFGEAISSRLAGYCVQREVKGEDRRLEP